MKTILRLYLNTSKGNDPFLYRELTSLKLKPKYDEHLHSFYLDTPLHMLFYLSFHSLVVQNMYVQIGKPFPAINEEAFHQSLQRMQFKNYIGMKRGLIENMTLKIITRQTQYPLSDKAITSFLQNYLQKQIVKKEYLQNILQVGGGSSSERNVLPFYEMREIVQRKWEEEDLERQEYHLKLLTGANQLKQIEQKNNMVNYEEKVKSEKKPQIGRDLIEQALNNELISQLNFHPQLTFYVRRNQGRFLLKVNNQEMYKYGWKKRVGWGPIRQSIVASILYQTKILQNKNENIKIWDPFCGSGTIALVAAAQFYSLGIRQEISENFNWPYWSIYKNQYLEEFLKERDIKNKENRGKLSLICSDINFQAINYTIGNLKELQLNFPSGRKDQQQKKAIVKRIKATDQIYELNGGEWVVLCGDFDKIAQNVMIEGQKINIITNLPYTEARSKQHIPLNQLNSIYNRFSKMISRYSKNIANVFIIINNDESAIKNSNHFLKISKEEWHEISSFESGGKDIGLFAWSKNQIKPEYEDQLAVYNQIKIAHSKIENELQDKDIETNLVEYRQRIQKIDQKNYFIPKHLLRFKKGYRRVIQKRRRRHLLRAFQLFARRRDKMIAFNQYANKKLEIKMLRRGSIWRKRNTRILSTQNILMLEKELKNEFQGRIAEALKVSEEKQKQKEEKKQKSKEFVEERRQKKKALDYKRYQSRNVHVKRANDIQKSQKSKRKHRKQ